MRIRPEFALMTDVDLMPTGYQTVEKISELYTEALNTLEGLIPPGRERSLAITKLQEAHYWAVRGVIAAVGMVAP